jgi:hypothetical protein
MPIGSLRQPGAANQVLEPGITMERQVIRPDNGASYFWRTTTYNSFVRGRRSGNFCARCNFCGPQPLGVSVCKKEKPPGTQSRAASVPLKSSPKKGIHHDDIPPHLRMSGQFCTNRDFKGYGVPKWKIVGPEYALKPFLSR